MPGLTPYRQIRYPLAGEVVDAAAIQAMSLDINSALATSLAAYGFSRTRSLVRGTASPSVAKTTTSTFNLTVSEDTGVQGPGTAPYWAAGQPTRLTAPASGLYLSFGTLNFGALPSAATSEVRATTQKNGANPQTASQGGRNLPPTTPWVHIWQLNAGDFVQIAGWWNGTPAGPLSATCNWYFVMMALT